MLLMPVFCWQRGTIDGGTSLIFGARAIENVLGPFRAEQELKFLAVGVKQLRDIISVGSIVNRRQSVAL